MGRGSDYSGTHEYYLLIDDTYPSFYSEAESDELREFDPWLWENFLNLAAECFDAYRWDVPVQDYFPYHRDIYLFADTDRLVLGINFSGGLPALFVHPKTYTHISGVEKEYLIRKYVIQGFNALIKALDSNEILRHSSGSWMSYPASKYPA